MGAAHDSDPRASEDGAQMSGIQGRDSTVLAPHSASHGRERGRTGPSARTRRRIAYGALGALVPIAVALVLVLGPNTNAPPQHISSTPAQVPVVQKKTPLTQEARTVAMRFIQTAVAREHLDEAWNLVGPNLRGGLTKERWTTGENPVVPYPIDELEVAPYKVDESYETSALLEVALLPKKGSGVRAQVFFLELKRLGTGQNARWVVDNWVPRASAVVPR